MNLKRLVLSAATKGCPKMVAAIKRRRAARLSFSQFGEDLVLQSLLRGTSEGFYVDCGAFDPFIFSNTAIFYEKGWCGLNIEPQRSRHAIFEHLRPRDINLCEVISNEEGMVRFVEASMPTLSGVVNADGGKDAEKRTPKRLRDVLSEHAKGKKIDFLSVDCENHDLSVLQSNDWEQFRPRFVLVEDHSTEVVTDIDQWMHSVSFKSLIKLGPTKIFTDEIAADAG